MSKDRDDKRTIFRRIGGRIVPITVGAGAIAHGFRKSTVVGGDKRVKTTITHGFKKSRITTRFKGRRTGFLDFSIRKLATEKTGAFNILNVKGVGKTFEQGIGAVLKSKKLDTVIGTTVTRAGIRFAEKRGFEFWTIGVSKGKIVERKIKSKNVLAAVGRIRESGRLVRARKHIDSGVIPKGLKLKRFNRKFIAAGLALAAFGATQ